MTILPGVAANRKRLVFLCMVIASATALLYWPITGHGFINYDDYRYILKNPHVASGLTWPGLVWSFQCGYAANWHPLTWLSHMLDCNLYGLNPGGHHLSNLLIHAANSALLFIWLSRMTRSTWRSVFVAALFALHPLHVESVAWASERKDVLSAFFWILTMLAYVEYCRKPRWARYGFCLFLFALGLMSKPMLVTLPFVLLLLDVWPLGRLRVPGIDTAPLSAGEPARFIYIPGNGRWPGLSLLLEKLPFFGLMFCACILTYLAQKSGGALWTWQDLPLRMRLYNALISYVRYIGKTLWPADLAVIYPYPASWHYGWVTGAALLLVLGTVVLVWWAKRSPCLLLGWLWYLGTMVPVIGLVQVGDQAMADRYMYIPSIGLFVLLVWGINELGGLLKWSPGYPALGGAAILAACWVFSSTQIKYWQDTGKLFRHAIEVTTNNYVAYNALGKSEEDNGREKAAFDLYSLSVKIEPRYAPAQYNLGTALLVQGKLDEAMHHFALALKADPHLAEAHYNWGKSLLTQDKVDEAFAHFSKAAELSPDDPDTHYSLGTVFLRQSKEPEAVAQLEEAIRLKPDMTPAHWNLGLVRMKQGKAEDARAHFAEVVQGDPNNWEARLNLGLTLLELNRLAEGEEQIAEALRLKPNSAEIHYHMANVCIRQHKSKEACRHYREALRLQPGHTEALNGLAWILASDPDPSVRDGQEAFRLAQQACQATQHLQASFLVTVAAAHAEMGRLSEAADLARKARDLAQAAGEMDVAARAERLANLFGSGRTVAQALSSMLDNAVPPSKE